MNARTTEVQAAVQQLVMEQGECAPLELLPATNRLAWEDCRAWREGRIETPNTVLAVAALQVDPESAAVTEQPAEPRRHFGSHRLLFVENVVERLPGYPQRYILAAPGRKPP